MTAGFGGRLGARTPWTLVGGKGGVGKSTVATMLAVEAAGAGAPVLLLSTDPAHSLADVLDAAVGAGPVAIPGVPGLRAEELDAGAAHRAFLAEYREPLLGLLDAATYLDRDEITEFLDLSLPGADEVAAAIRLAALRDRTSRVVVDLAPTGHALRLLAAPGLLADWVAGLLALADRHEAVARAFGAGRALPDHESRLHALLDRLRTTHAALRDPEWTRFVLVTTAEPAVIAEARRLVDVLDRDGVPRAGSVINRSPDAASGADVAVLLARGDGEAMMLPVLETPPRGVSGLRVLLERAAPAARTERGPAGQPNPRRSVPTPEPARPAGAKVEVPLGRRLYLVAGKGGVGKSTVASALALGLADAGCGRVVVLGADPAGSLGEVWGCDVGPDVRPAPGGVGVLLRQVEVNSGWAGVREAVDDDARVALERLVGRGGVRLLGLDLPGADELVALLGLAELLDSGRDDAIVLDAAPTGHLLQLLRTPALSEAWVHAAMRLLLRYREVVEFSSPAERLLRLSRKLRTLREQLADPRHTWTGVVALPEPGPLAETGRLIRGLRDVCAGPDLLLVNRIPETGPGYARSDAVLEAAGRLARDRGAVLATAPLLDAGPCGAASLRTFRASWVT